MHQTMRWFGPQDTVSLRDLRQCGIKGIVTALHQIPVGDVWTVENIKERQNIIREAGLEWTVIESLPVHEDIKRKAGNYQLYIDNYKTSLKNIAKCGIQVITYNFMPVLDWLRTHHNFENHDGTKALRYEEKAFIYFDVYLLKRPGANTEYSINQKKEALEYGKKLSDEQRNTLFKNILLGLPGSKIDFTPEQVLTLLDSYKNIDEEKLRENLIYFLSEITPLAEELNLKLAIHPDDPPFSVLGLPRVMSTQHDMEQIFKAVPRHANGLCYCTGSLGARPQNDLLKIIDDFGDRIHFLHLRNIVRENEGVFRESEHLNGDNPMEEIVKKIILLMNKRNISLPMRPDHGFLHSLEENENHYPGYSLIGRLKGLAELRGLELGLNHIMKATDLT
ncbi:mannonate dehydratase [Abyssalbus ytuae]|uniref:Mannonate dehydratase n=2 Tax=Abyssalbus ytuae TaxID=2926907 RepID=A0A9E6ZV17_9FLAO|nr:mannonate dehydratase [Abyssalbus ytuae]UOB19473.1 mannonate dehydratase [Abyssalbus ytuae]